MRVLGAIFLIVVCGGIGLLNTNGAIDEGKYNAEMFLLALLIGLMYWR